MMEDHNAKIAELIFAQRFSERMEMAAWLGGAIEQRLEDGESVDAEYLATIIGEWARERIEAAS